ncbi:queuosine 5'-phosphate N-glycosylase/hydrolase isoform X2 [Oryctolagus cuniculus]|uniref:queuosine 5'-phosphate N-glycosylase/hydrolase isoform X2 n=1 Tax=Oryctolagus cuniculus TaxID=9986 RepID=UPI002231A973|nr:queuosine salvage protein isoform X2 [Oryctolagus cuniculus]
MDAPLPPRESAQFIAERSRDVFIDGGGVRRVAELLLAEASGPGLRLEGWKALHELNPQAADEAAVSWVFLTDTLNFSFWSESDEHKCLVKYRGRAYSGYWALCAAVHRALDQGIPITSASYYATVTLDEVRHIFRSDTEVSMPMMEERHRILNETGTILLEKFGGSFLNCVRKSENSAQKLVSLVVENFPSYRDVTQFELSAMAWESRRRPSKSLGPCTHVGDLEEAPCSWLWIGAVPGRCGLLGSEPVDGRPVSLCLCLSLSLFLSLSLPFK